MRTIISSLLFLASVFTMVSCQPEKITDGPSANGDDIYVDATFSIALGSQTKAFSDGTTVDRLYVGVYEVGADNAFTWVADNSGAPAAISNRAASVSFNGKLMRTKSYKVVFWAQKEGAPYTIHWSETAETGPFVTLTCTGDANDESRDAFYGSYDTGVVTGDIDLTGSPVSLKRPFAQVNVLVPNSYVDDLSAAVTSSMSVAQAPTMLNLATKATGTPADWTFSAASINEPAFGSFANTHKYVAMNYILVDQSAAGSGYDITFSVNSGTQVAADKTVNNVPLRCNGRCNIVGNIFDENFNFTIPVIIDPDYEWEEILTEVIVAVGQTEADAVVLDAGYNDNPSLRTAIPVGFAINHTIEAEAEQPEITVEPSTVATAEWNLATGKLDVTPQVANGSAVITLVFPSVTRSVYSSCTAKLYVKVGTGDNNNTAPATPDFTTVAELKALLGAESASFTGTLTDAVVTFIAGTSDAVIKDASASILYHKETGHCLMQGQTISGDVIVDAVIYNGINEITDLAATVEGAGSAVEPEVVTLAQLAANYAAYESAYVKVLGVTSQTTTTTKGNITGRQDATDYVIYTNVAIPVNAGDIFTAEGTVTKYNTTEQLKVWKAADLTVTTPAPILSASPANTTVAAATTSVTWNITSNTDWTITPGAGVTPSTVSGNGNAEVTLSFAANEGSDAATYTATVSAEGCDDVTITITQNGTGSSSTITDELTASLFTATNTTYADFSNVAETSNARYAGNSAKTSSGGIQLRSKNSNSGIVSTISGGKLKSVTVTVESGTPTVDIYASNTAYTSAVDLYATGGNNNQGTKVASLSENTWTFDFSTLEDDYAYIGIRSNSGAIYLSKIEIEWE